MKHLMLDVVTEERIRVRYGETDAMGHAYYGNYLLFFEQARGAWCRERGFSYGELEAMGYFLPVVEAHLRYKGSAVYDDVINVKVRVTEVKRAAVRWDYDVVNETTGQTITEGYTWHVLIGAEKKAMTIPDDVMAMMMRDPVTTPTAV
jgi:acyl-CoA thioester hydrolase